MGERGQILMENSGVYLYTHWRGKSLKNILQIALRKKWRWGDEEYLTRIIFEELIGDERGTETGFGIGIIRHIDLNHPLLVVDVKKQEVKKEETSWSFEGFLKAKF